MLTSLSDLLREVLRRGDTREVELAEELRVLEPYLDISRLRFGERLSIEVSVHDGASRGLVPFFISPAARGERAAPRHQQPRRGKGQCGSRPRGSAKRCVWR
jgi:hypothetical protein